MGEPGSVNRVRALRAPDSPACGQPQAGPALAGKFRTAGERTGKFLLRRRAGVFDQGPSGGEPARVTGLGQDRSRSDRRQPGNRGDQLGELKVVEDPGHPGLVPARRRWVWRQSSIKNPTRSSAPGRWAITPAGSVTAANN
jgi:hypothetical protein